MLLVYSSQRFHCCIAITAASQIPLTHSSPDLTGTTMRGVSVAVPNVACSSAVWRPVVCAPMVKSNSPVHGAGLLASVCTGAVEERIEVQCEVACRTKSAKGQSRERARVVTSRRSSLSTAEQCAAGAPQQRIDPCSYSQPAASLRCLSLFSRFMSATHITSERRCCRAAINDPAFKGVVYVHAWQ